MIVCDLLSKDDLRMVNKNFKNRKVTICVANNTWFDRRSWYEPMTSVPILTAILKDKVNLSLIDANCEGLTLEETKKMLVSLQPEICLITALSVEYYKSYHAFAQLAKDVNPECTVVMGGVYPTTLAEEVIKDGNVDYAFMGHAEERIDKFVSYILGNSKAEIRLFPGIAYHLKLPTLKITTAP